MEIRHEIEMKLSYGTSFTKENKNDFIKVQNTSSLVDPNIYRHS